MGNADWSSNCGSFHRRRRGAGRHPQTQQPKVQATLGDIYLEKAKLGHAREQHAKAAADGDTALVASLEASFPVLKPAPAPPPKSALEQMQQASTKAMRAKRRLDKAIDWAAELRVKLQDAEKAAVQFYVEAQVADEAHATAREAHARMCALPAQQRQELAPTPKATVVFGCDHQGLEQDEDIKAALAQLQHLQQAFVLQVQAKRAAASPTPSPVPAATPPGGRPSASGPPAAQPDIGTPEVHEMGDAGSGTRSDDDPAQEEEAQRVELARVQLLADVKSAEDEQKKQPGAMSER